MEFQPFPKIPRLSRNCVVTEKLDGTNASIYIPTPDEEAFSFKKVWAGSRTRWLEPGSDNYGFCKWVDANYEDLLKLGYGHHFGEWWGKGIQRNYGLTERRFSLFNTARWGDPAVRPAVCHVVPVLYEGPFDMIEIQKGLWTLGSIGSLAAPGFMKPEGVVIYHEAAKQLFKKTLENDDAPKGREA